MIKFYTPHPQKSFLYQPAIKEDNVSNQANHQNLKTNYK